MGPIDIQEWKLAGWHSKYREILIDVTGHFEDHHLVIQNHWWPEPWFNIKMLSYQYRKSHYGDETVVMMIGSDNVVVPAPRHYLNQYYYDRLISTMGFPILVRWHLFIESAPRKNFYLTFQSILSLLMDLHLMVQGHLLAKWWPNSGPVYKRSTLEGLNISIKLGI